MPFIVSLNRRLGHTQGPHGLVIDTVITPCRKGKCQRRGHTAITFLDVTVIEYQPWSIGVWRRRQIGNRSGLEQIERFIVNGPLDILGAAHGVGQAANLRGYFQHLVPAETTKFALICRHHDFHSSRRITLWLNQGPVLVGKGRIDFVTVVGTGVIVRIAKTANHAFTQSPGAGNQRMIANAGNRMGGKCHARYLSANHSLDHHAHAGQGSAMPHPLPVSHHPRGKAGRPARTQCSHHIVQ